MLIQITLFLTMSLSFFKPSGLFREFAFQSLLDLFQSSDDLYDYTRPPIPRIHVWAPALDGLQINITRLIPELANPGSQKLLQMSEMPVKDAYALQESNVRLRSSISKDLDPAPTRSKILGLFQVMERKPASHYVYDERPITISGMIYHFFFPPWYDQLVLRAEDLSKTLREAHASREGISLQIQNDHKKKLDSITNQVCRASELLQHSSYEARRSSSSDSFLQAFASAHLLCQEIRSDNQSLRDLLDKLRAEMELIEEALNQIQETLQNLQWANTLSDIEIDAYERTYALLGRKVAEMLDGNLDSPQVSHVYSSFIHEMETKTAR
ncbi:hypothetical protein FALBO_7619 [Fusarium albosuccineum]|uniref:Uncharacterized protein n=1 Tax=Fusarium albosuccineum TaxID=1237068 RepID=A0A8H4L9H4_9HYPO|nr:hypothetical protein FALBO_7619 [Fusarium albosuccineum]